MATALSIVTLAAVVLLGVLVVRLLSDVQALRKHLKQRPEVVIPAYSDHHYRAPEDKGYYALWRWDNKKWGLVLGVIPPGASAGLPPKEPGQCTGETKKVWVPVSRA